MDGKEWEIKKCRILTRGFPAKTAFIIFLFLRGKTSAEAKACTKIKKSFTLIEFILSREGLFFQNQR